MSNAPSKCFVQLPYYNYAWFRLLRALMAPGNDAFSSSRLPEGTVGQKALPPGAILMDTKCEASPKQSRRVFGHCKTTF